MIPSERAATEARTAGQVFENEWAQPRAEQEHRMNESRIKATDALSDKRESISPNAIPYLVSLGILTKEEARDMVLTPEMRVKEQQQKTMEEAQMAAERAAHEQQQSAPTPPQSNASYYGGQIGKGLDFYSRHIDPVQAPIRPILDWMKKPKK
jgi:hypothetical protein